MFCFFSPGGEGRSGGRPSLLWGCVIMVIFGEGAKGKMVKALGAFLLLFVMVIPVSGQAVSCNKVLQDIKMERHFLKKKEMIAHGIRQCPDSAKMNFKYGFSLERFNNYEEALSHYRRAAELDADFAAPLFGMGDIYLAQKQYKLAVTAYEKGLELEPLNTRALRSLLEAKGKLKQ